MKNSIINRRFKYSYDNATLYLVIANVLVFIITNTVWPRGIYYLSMIPRFVLSGYIYQFVTYMFVHASFSHILFNMISLFIFGSALEKRLGTKEFLLYYFIVGTLSGISSFIFYFLAGQNAILLGASGAIYGVLLLFAVFFPTSRIFVFGLIPIKAPYLIIMYFLIELYSHFSGSIGGVAHLTHLSGLIFGVFYCLIRMKLNPFEVWKRTL